MTRTLVPGTKSLIKLRVPGVAAWILRPREVRRG
jgi:hypothetical protein